MARAISSINGLRRMRPHTLTTVWSSHTSVSDLETGSRENPDDGLLADAEAANP
jgi:hypothetical protein